jgi:hypothetical protein
MPPNGHLRAAVLDAPGDGPPGVATDGGHSQGLDDERVPPLDRAAVV